jgi:hypothetical protein
MKHTRAEKAERLRDHLLALMDQSPITEQDVARFDAETWARDVYFCLFALTKLLLGKSYMSRHPRRAPLTQEERTCIQDRYRTGRWSLHLLAFVHTVSYSTVRRVVQLVQAQIQKPAGYHRQDRILLSGDEREARYTCNPDAVYDEAGKMVKRQTIP